MHAPRPHSVAGQWGAERRKQSSLMCTSSSRDDYGVHNKHESERASRNPFARFKGMQDSNPMILKFNERTTHMDCLEQEGTKNEDPLMTTTARAMNVRQLSFNLDSVG